VDIQQIYNEFSCGIPDPLAIREFLDYTQNRWLTKPGYVLLLGWGHYDYKNISTSARNWIAPYETLESLKPVHTYPSDDQFVKLGSSNSYALAIGRLPARNLHEAAVMVNKIITYETNSLVDPWRNRITFVADDGLTSHTDEGNTFTTSTEELAEGNTSQSYEKNKIYIVAYTTANSVAGRRKPDANRAIVDAINQGTLITNFIGHGNEHLWTHEAIFTQEDNLPQLYNKDRLTFIAAATCSFGRYDDAKELSAAEQLVTMEQGGAIADVSAARVVYDNANVELNKALYNYLLKKDTSGVYPRLGYAWRLVKSTRINEENSQKYHLFGDPTIRLLMPKNDAVIDSVNNIATLSVDTIKIKSLGCARITGALKQADTTATFNGTGILQLFDSQKDMVIVDGTDHSSVKDTFKFKVKGSLLYRGDVSVRQGRFTATVPIPKDVTFGKSARVSIYAWDNQKDGVGYTEKVMIDSIDMTAKFETDGPRMSVYLDDLAFQPGDVVKSNPTLIVLLNDSSGINTSTVGVGHQLSATISNPERTLDLSNYYHSNLDTYQSGEVRYPLRDLSDGKYTLRVKAWDIQNNSAEAETFFEVHSADDLAMLNVMNYPNPFSHSTIFTFQRNTTDPINVEIKIYSIAGRLIGKFSMPSADRFVRIPWNGRDNDESELANGIYFYKLITRSSDGKRTSETIGKLAVMR
jgi:hypothetical protein